MTEGRNSWVVLARYANLAFSLGVTMATSILLGFFGGRWLDRHFGTEPFLLLVGILLGTGLAFKSMIDEINTLTRENKRNHKQD